MVSGYTLDILDKLIGICKIIHINSPSLHVIYGENTDTFINQ